MKTARLTAYVLSARLAFTEWLCRSTGRYGVATRLHPSTVVALNRRSLQEVFSMISSGSGGDGKRSLH